MITYDCPHCGKHLKIPDEYAGKQGKCAGCRSLFTVPGSTPPPKAPRRSVPSSAPEPCSPNALWIGGHNRLACAGCLCVASLIAFLCVAFVLVWLWVPTRAQKEETRQRQMQQALAAKQDAKMGELLPKAKALIAEQDFSRAAGVLEEAVNLKSAAKHSEAARLLHECQVRVDDEKMANLLPRRRYS